MSLLRRASARHLLHHPGQLGLCVVGVGLGVAVVLAMDLAIQSAREGFRVSAETVAGRATTRLVGGPRGIADSVFARIRLEAGIRAAAPVVEGIVTTPALPGRALRLLGVDPFSEGAVRPWLAGGGVAGGGRESAEAPDGQGGPGADLLAPPVGVVLEAGTAAEAGVAPGDSLVLVAGARRELVPVVGVLEAADDAGREGLRELVVADVSRAQAILGTPTRLSRIDVALPGGAAGRETMLRLRRVLPPDVVIQDAGTRTRTMEDMVRAFDLNLTALSLLALVFGMFLIYNAVTFSVVQRRELLGTLRALGVTRGEVVGIVLGEATVLGVAGTLPGLAVGTLLGRGLVHLVTRTVNDLYFVLSVEGLSIPAASLVKAATLGVTATVLAALPGAREAARTVPREAMTRSVVEERWRRLVPVAAWAGVALLAVGGGLLLPPWGIVASFAALFAVILGIALLTPLATVLLMAVVRPLARRTVGVLGTLATRGVVRALSRTGPAVTALVVAVSVTVGLGVMIASFRGSLVRWLDRTLQADVYVSVPSIVSSRAEGTLPDTVVRVLRGDPSVAGLNTYRGAVLPTADGEVRILAVELDPRGEAAFRFLAGDPSRALGAFRRAGAVLVSEPFAYRNDLAPGDSVRLPTEEGTRAFAVAGVYRDYGSDRGVVMIARATWERFWSDPSITSLGLFLQPGIDADAATEALRRRAEDAAAALGGAVTVRSNRQLRERSLEVFDRTFAITGVLRALAFVVAFIGIVSALMALHLEKVRELGVLRATGLTPGQLRGLVTAQTGLLGAAAGLLAVPAGVVLAAVMIFVVDRRSFGWTLSMELGPGVVAEALLLGVVGALLAGVWPAWRMARTPPAEALRTE